MSAEPMSLSEALQIARFVSGEEESYLDRHQLGEFACEALLVVVDGLRTLADQRAAQL